MASSLCACVFPISPFWGILEFELRALLLLLLEPPCQSPISLFYKDISHPGFETHPVPVGPHISNI
jgi:hypothetical protein